MYLESCCPKISFLPQPTTLPEPRKPSILNDGEVAEWLKAPDSKSDVGVTLPGVRIPPSPPALFPPVAGSRQTRFHSIPFAFA